MLSIFNLFFNFQNLVNIYDNSNYVININCEEINIIDFKLKLC
jgi:hypothetical protein